MPDFTPSSAGISRDLAANSHKGTSFDPEKRAEQEINNFVIEMSDEEIREMLKKKGWDDCYIVGYIAGYRAKENEARA